MAQFSSDRNSTHLSPFRTLAFGVIMMVLLYVMQFVLIPWGNPEWFYSTAGTLTSYGIYYFLLTGASAAVVVICRNPMTVGMSDFIYFFLIVMHLPFQGIYGYYTGTVTGAQMKSTLIRVVSVFIIQALIGGVWFFKGLLLKAMDTQQYMVNRNAQNTASVPPSASAQSTVHSTAAQSGAYGSAAAQSGAYNTSAQTASPVYTAASGTDEDIKSHEQLKQYQQNAQNVQHIDPAQQEKYRQLAEQQKQQRQQWEQHAQQRENDAYNAEYNEALRQAEKAREEHGVILNGERIR